MSTKTLRSLLILFGWVSFPGLIISTTMLVFGPYLSVPGSIENLGSYLYIQFLIAVLAAPGITAISFWAAHNLKNLKFLKPETLAKFLLLSVFLNFLCFLFALIAIPLEISIYGSANGNAAAPMGYAVATFFYASTAALLLIFARKQLIAKMAGDKMKETTLADAFS